MKNVSEDLLWRAVFLLIDGHSIRSVSQRLQLHRATVRKAWHLYQACNEVKTPARAKRETILNNNDMAYLDHLVEVENNLFLDEYADKLLIARGKHVSISTVYRALKKLGHSRRKLATAAAEASSVLQADFMLRASAYSVDQLVFIDEVSSDQRNYSRKYGWGKVGTKIRSRGVFIRGQRFSSMGVMDASGIDHYTIEGSFDSESLLQFAEEFLLTYMKPFPAPKSVLVLDNASTHHIPEFLTLLENHGIRVLFLPPYSPWLNPIELAFAKVKKYIRRSGRDLVAQQVTPHLVICKAFNSVTQLCCRNFISHSGYS